MTKTQKEKMIFLNDKLILPWQTPTPENAVSMLGHFRASTTLKKFLGYDSLKAVGEPYVISATAVMYLTEIARKREGEDDFAGPKYKPEEEVLFLGGVQVYKEGEVSVNKINGADLVLNERLWYANKIPKSVNHDLLEWIILGTEHNGERTERIDKIIRGYEFQKKKAEERRRFNERITRGGWER